MGHALAGSGKHIFSYNVRKGHAHVLVGVRVSCAQMMLVGCA